ncbi:MAG: NAD(P)-dependent oxidoreductase [Paralcaligenes sp.]
MSTGHIRANPAGVGRLGMIGVGHMGEPMALRLIQAGHALVVYDTNTEHLERLSSQGASVADSPADVGNKADTVLVCLPNPDAVEQVALGPRGLVQGQRFSTYVDLSTTGPIIMRKVVRVFEELGVATLDCPISGGVTGARNGTLAIMAAGTSALFDKMHPVLETLGKAIFHVGEQPGLGQIMKLVNNLLAATAWTITAEGLAIGTKAGLDPTLMLSVLNASSGRNIATEDRFERYILSRKFDSGFTMAGIYKDISLCMGQAEASDVPAPIGQALQRLWRGALTQGWGDRSHAHIARLYEIWADVEFNASTGTQKHEGPE